MTVHANKAYYHDVWNLFLEWSRGFKHIPGFFAVHSNTPITQRAIAQGVAKGRNSLGLENSGDKPLASKFGSLGLPIGGRPLLTYLAVVLYFGISFDNESDIPKVFPSFDDFVEKAHNLAEQRKVLHRYMSVPPRCF
jgi:hypothetical protein